MEVIKGKIVSSSETAVPEPKREVELFTAPVPVRRYKLPFGAVIAVQFILSAAIGGFIWWAKGQSGEAGEIAAELIRRFLNG